MKAHINAPRCVEYLRRVGVDVSDETAALWVATERETRARRRAHKREAKQSCGHFRRHWTTIYHDDGATRVQSCTDCGQPTEYQGASL